MTVPRRSAVRGHPRHEAGTPPTALVCHACGWRPDPDEPYPFRCARAGDGGDHVLVRRLEPLDVRFDHGDAAHPFVRHRELLHAYWRARAGGLPDAWFVETVVRLDRAVAGVAGTGFHPTPLLAEDLLSERLGFTGPGRVWSKDETRNVSGSHKARHLFGLALHLEVAEALKHTTREETNRRRLAIASCGNAALAAAVVARAADRPLDVFLPEDAHPRVVERLGELGARVTVCPRQRDGSGDPCMHRFRDAVRRGAVPFCVQGPENGLAIEGGHTLGWELAAQLDERGVRADRIVLQVGGGALAAAVAEGLREAVVLGALEAEPRLHTVQTEGCWPLRRAWNRLHEHAPALAGGGSGGPIPLGPAPYGSETYEVEEARALQHDASERERLARALDDARRTRARYMWPWESPPHSAAHGILDDETYDFVPVLEAHLRTRGYPLVVNEAQIAMGWSLGREGTSIRADASGTAGLAGLMALRSAGVVGSEEQVVVLFTGAERG